MFQKIKQLVNKIVFKKSYLDINLYPSLDIKGKFVNFQEHVQEVDDFCEFVGKCNQIALEIESFQNKEK